MVFFRVDESARSSGVIVDSLNDTETVRLTLAETDALRDALTALLEAAEQ